ncbi:ArsR/SmtB family transcription factor [Tahibacter caeni]|uniref:ArsR/SmtB family transcription factor n=1 Tax=Tahibacter caeni TaxID=1453545 RepID=UPI002148B264|nr:metalloregulator ArsR/SmtB family transcription factor [Tahibacter caeni]
MTLVMKRGMAAAMAAQAEHAADLLKAMAHPQRLRVLCLLVEGELSVGDINREIELSQSALSQHLAKLREEGLVDTRKEAQTVFYRLADSPAVEVIRALHDAFCPADTPRRRP